MLLSFSHSGAQELLQQLSETAGLACTSGTGIIPLCQVVADTWRQVDGGASGSLSQLAAASVRSQASALVTTILAGSGKARWCELATSAADVAETFLQLFPATRFICVHRACQDLIAAGAAAHPWNIAIGEFGSFPGLYPGNRAAALAAYWASHTERMLAFEDAHADSCLRIRYEDLVTDQETTMAGVLHHLGITEVVDSHPDFVSAADAAAATEAKLGNGAAVAVSAIPGPLTQRINGLLGTLGYPALTSD